jgi:fructan beta-fructosidase
MKDRWNLKMEASSLHIFLDDSSIEVFGNKGETVLSERIFPSPESIEVEYYSKGGNSEINSLKAWELKSIWHP